MNLHEIVKTWLKEHGYDGLYNEWECGCSIDDFMPCGEPGEHCMPGYEKLTPSGDSDFIICPEKQDNND